MAEIPVEKKSGIPWWIWLLLAVLLVALIWWFAISKDGDDDAEVFPTESSVEMSHPSAAGSADPGSVPDASPDVGVIIIPDMDVITTLDILTAQPLDSLIGRQIDLDGVPVESLEGDMSFYVGVNNNSRALVVFEEVPTPDTAKEGRIDVNPGNIVSIAGSVVSMSDLPEGISTDLHDSRTAVILAKSVNRDLTGA